MTKTSRLSFIRSRAVALRCVSLASSASVGFSYTEQASVSPSVLPLKSAHVWRTNRAEKVESADLLPVGFIPSPVAAFTPAINAELDAEVKPLAYAEALPEIGSHELMHAVNCSLLCLMP
jgi:hypothetical protein